MTDKAAGAMIVSLVFNGDDFPTAESGSRFGWRCHDWKRWLQRPDITRAGTERDPTAVGDATKTASLNHDKTTGTYTCENSEDDKSELLHDGSICTARTYFRSCWAWIRQEGMGDYCRNEQSEKESLVDESHISLLLWLFAECAYAVLLDESS